MDTKNIADLKAEIKASMIDRDANIRLMRQSGKTLQYIANKHGITRARVQQILNEENPKPHYLYRCFDSNDKLLYVGCTSDIHKRNIRHKNASKWHSDVAAIIYEKHQCRADALDAEKAAIKKESPIHNVMHTSKRPKENSNRSKSLSAFENDMWGPMILDILKRGYTLDSLAEYVGLTGPALSALGRHKNQQPGWAVGDRLISLHKKVMLKCPKVDVNA